MRKIDILNNGTGRKTDEKIGEVRKVGVRARGACGKREEVMRAKEERRK